MKTERERCVRRGGERLEPGSLGSFGLTFRPGNTRSLTSMPNDVEVKANMCLDCGMVEFIGDAEKARRLAGERGAGALKARG